MSNTKATKKKAAVKATKKNTGTAIGSFVVRVRTSRDLTTRELASLIGTSGPYISLIESGRYHLPTDFIKMLVPRLNEREKAEILDILFKQLKKDTGL